MEPRCSVYICWTQLQMTSSFVRNYFPSALKIKSRNVTLSDNKVPQRSSDPTDSLYRGHQNSEKGRDLPKSRIQLSAELDQDPDLSLSTRIVLPSHSIQETHVWEAWASPPSSELSQAGMENMARSQGWSERCELCFFQFFNFSFHIE